MIYRIDVTQEDINCGLRGGSYSCPIALAVKRATKRDKVAVGLRDICVSYGIYTPLPLEAQRFVRDFDRHAIVKPFTFVINLL